MKREAESMRLFYYPGYSNPYQKLLYGSFPPGWQIAAEPLEAAMQYLIEHPDQKVIFHLHWEDALYKNEPDEMAASNQANSFIRAAAEFRKRGGKLAWTVHNFVSHECPYRETELFMRKSLAELSDVAFTHTATGRKAIIEKLPALSSKVIVAPHGNYSGFYAGNTPREEARRIYGFSREERVFIAFGDLRRHKRVDWILEALALCTGNNPQIKALVAGLCFPGSDLDPGILSITPNVVYVPGRIPDIDVQPLFAASDFAIFASGTQLTSGSMILALSFGIPVIGFNTGDAVELIRDGVNGFLVDEQSPQALAGTMRRAALLSKEERVAMADEALHTAESLTWDKTAAIIESALKGLFQKRSIFRQSENGHR